MSDNKRTVRYIDSGLQGSLMFRLGAYWFIYNAALMLTLFGQKLLWVVPDLVMGGGSENAGVLFQEFLTQAKPLLLAMGLFCPLMIWDMMRYSHRFAGPLYRFRKAMADHMSGEPLKSVRLRDDDLLHEFQGTFNEFVAYVRQNQGAVEHSKSDDKPAAADTLESESV